MALEIYIYIYIYIYIILMPYTTRSMYVKHHVKNV